MDAQRWERLQAIFAEAVELPTKQQEAAVRDLCGEDDALAASVLEMLAEDARGESLLDGEVGDVVDAALHSDRLRSLIQQQIGPYRLLRVLGEGGMGIVYLAERTDIGGLVAIKLLRDAWLSPMRRERFAFEQQTLVKLNHPSIARIYDANTMEDGTPWFVMEYADGVPVTEFLKARQGSVRNDLLLFRRVCEAVQYAHGHAILHRDLKPSNIFVTAEGEVKLLDFGIAKQMNPDGEDPLRTTTGLRAMTPAYAAPEQWNGGTLGVFTDIFALGVLLYEILAGGLPQAQEGGRTLPKPSRVAGSRGGTGRGLSAREWSDLDVLCLTAFHIEPQRRYRSVDALLYDLDAFLQCRALLARPDSFGYVAGKYIQRNRAALLATAAASLLMVLGATLFTVSLTRARNAALAELARTERIQRFTETLFDGGSRSAGPAREMTTAELLKRGEAEAEHIRDDPRMQDDMFTTLGQVYQRLGQLDRAEGLLTRAAKQQQEKFGPKDKQYAEGLIALGLLRKDQSSMEEAEKTLRQGLSLTQQVFPRHDPAIEYALWALGSVLSLRGEYAESKRVLEAAVQEGSRSGKNTEQLADDVSQLADVHFYLADYGSAEDLDRCALGIYRETVGENHPSVARVYNNLGSIADDRDESAKAEADFRRALKIDEAWYGADHPDVAFDLVTLSKVLKTAHAYDEAQALLDRALIIQRRSYGEVHSRVALTYNDLGVLAYTRDRDDEAEGYFRKALAIWLKVYGERHQFIGLSYDNLAGVSMDRKDYPLAEQMIRKSLQVYAQTLPEGHIRCAIAHVKLGRILDRQHRYAEAEPESLKGFRYFSVHGSPQSSYLIGARRDLIDIETNLHKHEMVAQFQAQVAQPALH